MLGLRLLERGSFGIGPYYLAAVRANRLRLGAETRDEIAKSRHGFEGSNEMGSVEHEHYGTDS